MSTKSQSLWPLAFFILNLLAIAAWFFLTGALAPGQAKPVSFSPRGSELDADSIEHIDVVFDSPLDPASVEPHAVRLHPPAPGTAELVDGRTLRFRLGEKLQPATSYRLAWSEKLRGSGGREVRQELHSFATARPAVVAAEQAGFDNNSYTVQISFNQPVRAETLAAALSSRFTGDGAFRGDDRRVRVFTSGAARSHRVKVSAEKAGWLVLRLAGGMTATAGNLGLEKDTDLVWRLDGGGGKAAPEWATAGDPRDLKPSLAFHGMEASWEDEGGVVVVRASSSLNSAEAAKFVSVEPDVPFSCLSSWGGMKIAGQFEPGRQYRVTLRPGLPAGAAGEISTTISRNVWFDDKPPSLDFSFGGGYLLPSGMLKVPVTSTNVDTCTLRLRRLYADNLVETALSDHAARVEEHYAGAVRETRIATGGKRNEKTETLVDLRELIDGRPAGVYGVEIYRSGDTWHRRRATIVVSDIGLGARLGREQLFAWTMSLGEGAPLPGSAIRVYSNRRQFLAEGVTGDDGVVDLKLPPLPEGEEPTLVVASANGETTFVHLGSHRNSRGAALGGGAAHPGAYQAFVAADRGVYRGGETVHVSLVVRDRDVRDIPAMPVEISVNSVDGKVRGKAVRTTDPHGRAAAELVLPRALATGSYQILVRVPGHAEAMGRTHIQVADYIPETLRLSVSLSGAAVYDRSSSIAVRAERLAGGDAAQLRGKVLAEYRPAPFRPDGWKDWSFGDRRLENRNEKTVERSIETDTDGSAAAEWPNPPVESAAAVSLSVRTEIFEPGGRATGEHAETLLHQVPFYLGAKAESPLPAAGEEVSFLFAAVAPGGSAATPPSGWRARLYRIEHSGLLRRRDDGRLVYDWQRREVLEEEASGTWEDARGNLVFPSLNGGGYRLVVESETGKAVTLDFSVRGGGGWTGADPEALALKLSRPRHPVDTTAEVLVDAPFAGSAIVAVEGDRVLKHWIKTLKEGENTLEIPVDESMRPNAYVTVTLVRPVAAEETWRPHRAVGAVSLEVDNRDRRLVAAIDAPDAAAPGGNLPVAVRVTDAEGNKVAKAAVVLWGVDEGVLGLTGYRSPSPWEHFYRKRRLDVADADMYSRLAPELAAWRQGRDPLPGGSDGSSGLARRLNPVAADRVRTEVVFRGELTTDENGVASVAFPVPEIASKLRLMAWASAGRKMGAGDKEIDVKAPVSFLASWPRFAAPGDEFQVVVTLLNRSGADAEVTLTASAEGGLELTPASLTVPVPDEGTRQISLKARASGPGKARALLAASRGEDTYTQTMELPVRPPVLFQRRSGVREIPAGEKARLVLAKDLLPENGRLKLTLGGSPQIKLSGTLEYLVGYPYACGEQTASRLAALVALPDLLALSRPGQFGDEEAAELARSCMDRLAALQTSRGGFRMWPGWEDAEFWLSAHILSLLEECAERGWQVPEAMLGNCREYLSDNLDHYVELLAKAPGKTGSEDERHVNGEDAALACLALSRGNALRRSWLVRMNEIADERALAGSPLASQALAFLCHATLLAGDPALARRQFASHAPGGEAQGIAPDSHSALAAWLAAGLRLGVPRADLAGMAALLEQKLPDSYTRLSTRENVRVLLALGKYWQRFRPQPASRGRLRTDGVEREFSLLEGLNLPGLVPGSAIQAEAKGEDPMHVVWTAEGIPASGKAEEEDVGMRARRSVFSANGAPLSPPYSLRQGEVYRIRIDVTGKADDLVIADLLPAGLEVENPRLKGRDGERSAALGIAQVERRDDRLLLFGSVRDKGFYEYLCRAVTPGTYVWPALDAGRMYDSAVRSVHGQERLTVTAAGENGDE